MKGSRKLRVASSGRVPVGPDLSVPVGPVLSIYDPVYLGIDEFGAAVSAPMMYRNIAIGGEPGAGKSSLLNNVVSHAALSSDCRLVLLDGKQVEMGLWRDVAEVFCGPDVNLAIDTLTRLQTMMDKRYEYLLSEGLRNVSRADGFHAYLIAIDELAYFSVTAGDKKTQETFASKLRDLVARGRAVGIIVAAATQRPSSDIIPTSLRDLFAWRFCGRTSNDVSSDIVLGHGWAGRGFSANVIDPDQRGVGFLISEGGSPRRVKAAYLTDADIRAVAEYAKWIRREPVTAPWSAVAGSVPVAVAA